MNKTPQMKPKTQLFTDQCANILAANYPVDIMDAEAKLGRAFEQLAKITTTTNSTFSEKDRQDIAAVIKFQIKMYKGRIAGHISNQQTPPHAFNIEVVEPQTLTPLC